MKTSASRKALREWGDDNSTTPVSPIRTPAPTPRTAPVTPFGTVPFQRYCICLVSDFFYPRMGGVEMHQYFLAQGLLRRGHKVILITGSYNSGERQGIRYMSNGLKVYHIPVVNIVAQASFPTFFAILPLVRNILIREKVDIVHGHQSTSMLAHVCILHGKTLGLKTVFTDHSLFSLAELASVVLNKFMKFTLSDVDHVICVSHTSRENLVLRAYLDPVQVSVIPNAVDVTKFTPDPDAAPSIKDQINIIIVSRLVYRKGVDLVVDIIPEICKRFPKVRFIIGGDGPKRLNLEEMRELHQLHDRVEMLGSIQHGDVKKVLNRGHIFLNCSLTEAFCIAILEAVTCGLYTVSTGVGGVPEVLPEHMISLTEPNVTSIVDALSYAILNVKNVRPLELHAQVREMYNWHQVAERTELVYDHVISTPNQSLFERLCKFYACGIWAGKLFAAFVSFDYLMLILVEWLFPVSEIDIALDFPVYDVFMEMGDAIWGD